MRQLPPPTPPEGASGAPLPSRRPGAGAPLRPECLPPAPRPPNRGLPPLSLFEDVNTVELPQADRPGELADEGEGLYAEEEEEEEEVLKSVSSKRQSKEAVQL